MKTKDDWWRKVDEQKEVLEALIGNYHPSMDPAVVGTITAQRAENIRLETAAQIRAEAERGSPVAHYKLACATRNAPAAYALLEQTWWGVPENAGSRDIPGFPALCDLCSEYNTCVGEYPDEDVRDEGFNDLRDEMDWREY